MVAHGTTSGETLGGRYVLRAAGWTSPLGAVWEARDTVLNRSVWVQLLDGGLAREPAVRRRMAKNAAAIAQVAHLGVARIFDIGNEPAFIVFEHGRRLSDALARGAMRTNDAARAALALARGLEALHAAGLTHGSLAPGNVLLDEEGRARVIALGIANTLEAVTEIDPADEQPDGYRPPEPAPPDAADRYALAALTYHMLHGRTPGGVATRKLVIPTGLTSLLNRALSPDPEQRPTLDAFIGGLAPFARVEPPKARRPRAVASEFRWLVPALLVVAFAAVALTFGARFITDIAGREPAASASPAPTTGEPLAIAEVGDFDPHGSDEQENPDEVDLAIDGDPTTSWSTVNYAARDFDKPGVGLLLDLGASQQIAALELVTELPGWTAQVRLADTPGDDETAFEVAVEEIVATEETTRVDLASPITARYVLLWFVEGADRGAGGFRFKAEVAEVSVYA